MFNLSPTPIKRSMFIIPSLLYIVNKLGGVLIWKKEI